MTFATRVFLGALFGALIVLIVHPRSRPYIISSSLVPKNIRQISSTPSLPENLDSLAVPKSLVEASRLLQVGAEIELRGRKLSTDACISLGEIAKNGQESEPDNAYWSQMKSLFLANALGAENSGEKRSLEEWVHASKLTAWNDHQTSLLYQIVNELQSQTGNQFAWQYMVAASRRTTYATQKLLRHSRHLSSVNKDDLSARVANVFNGSLIRDGGKSISTSLDGATIVNLAGFQRPKSSSILGSARTTAEAYGTILKTLPVNNSDIRSQLVSCFLANETWFALVPIEESPKLFVDTARLSVLIAILPSSCLLAGIFGGVVFLIGYLLSHVNQVQSKRNPTLCVALALVLSTLTLFGTGIVALAAWVLVTVILFVFRPDRARAIKPEGLGHVFTGLLSVLAVVVAFLVLLLCCQVSAPGTLLAKASIFIVSSQGTGKTELNLIILCLSFVVASAPVWGYLYRYTFGKVLSESLMKFGSILGLFSLIAAVISTPVCMIADKKVAVSTKEILENESVHYLVKASGP